MNKLLIWIIMMGLAYPLFSQDTDLDRQDPKARDKIQAARIALISEKLKLTPAQAEKFWPIYREFTEQRADLRKQFREAERNQDVNKTKADREQRLIRLGLELKQQNVDLEKKYSERLLNVISAQQLLTLPKAEQEFTRILMQRLQERQEMREQRQEMMKNRMEQRQREKNN
ncbi:MAG: Spy/CpxP family protein refolding chaperone [Cytophagales bacterium]